MKTLPSEIERGSMDIITGELKALGIALPPENAAVILRCIHASADFDYAENLRFTPGAAAKAVEALRGGAQIVTDTNMALAGISRPGLGRLGGAAYCFMAEDFIAERAKERGSTRAVAAIDYAAENHPDAVLAVGNAPTALFRIAEKIEAGLRPALVIAAPVGFVNVV
ncbi:MAG: precorrin-8X methylmutase, partial [Oscillospiraceae bacterium]|nr:precorrin-8X methylmutase [Oscillospiraceae bacterium]